MKTNKITETKIDKLIPDNINANKGTEYGQHLVESSLRQFGAGRSILLDKNNRIIAGNKTIENAAAIGLENVIVIETTGDQIVAVKRTDVDLDSKFGRELMLRPKPILNGMKKTFSKSQRNGKSTRLIGESPNLKFSQMKKNRKKKRK